MCPNGIVCWTGKHLVWWRDGRVASNDRRMGSRCSKLTCGSGRWLQAELLGGVYIPCHITVSHLPQRFQRCDSACHGGNNVIRDRYSGTLFQQENKSDHETCRVGNYV